MSFSRVVPLRNKWILNTLSSCYHNIFLINRSTVICSQQYTNFHSKISKLSSSKDILIDNKNNFNNNSIGNENKDDENNSLNQIHKQFPEPKTTLHNYFQILSNELKSTEFKLPKPTFKLVSANKKTKSYWNCIYKIPWPQELKVESTGSTKQDASKKASLKVLNLLKRYGKLSTDGFPILYDKKQVYKENTINVELSNATVDKLQDIIDIYEKYLHTNVQKSKSLNLNVKFTEDDHQEIEKQYYQRKAEVKTNLPIENYRAQIIDIIGANQVTIIKGEPGCGKSTQVPQYIYDDWFEKGEDDNCEIIVSEPRRIAATSLAERVARERDEDVGETVGYHVRFDSAYNRESTAILYCTSGILLKRLQTDPSLKSVTHVILDEAHERDVNTDLLMVLLRKATQINKNLKIIIMSATIDVQLFHKYFNNAPFIEIPGFTYPVKSYFLNDIDLNIHKTRQLSSNHDENPTIVPEDICELIQWIHQTKSNDNGSILCFLPGWDDILKVKKYLAYDQDQTQLILPLHSKLSLKDQKRIFQKAPDGMRKIILATNIAETSITIDDVLYVIDTGAHKEQRLDQSKQRECIDNYWISQSNVNQRRGRAGRVQAGESYHLFTKEKYDNMDEFQLPEILRVSLTKLVLDTKVYDQEIKAVNFLQQFPNPPDKQAIERAVDNLIDLKVLDEDEHLTPLGKTIALFSLAPTLAKSLVYSHFFDCSKPVVNIITALSLDSAIFTGLFNDKSVIRSLKSNFNDNSDHLVYHQIIQEWKRVFNNNRHGVYNWCERHFINPFKMNLLNKLQEIHLNYLNSFKYNFPILNKYSNNDELVKSMIVAGLNSILFNKLIINRRQQKKQVLVSESGQMITIGSDSVNYKRKIIPSLLYCYSNDTHSIARRTTIVRETSVISPLTVLLFVNVFKQKNENDLAIFILERNPSLKFSLKQEHGDMLKKVKIIIEDSIQYLCSCHLQSKHLNDSTDIDIYDYWIDIVDKINSILIENSNS